MAGLVVLVPLLAVFCMGSVVCERNEKLFLMEVKLPTLEYRQETAELEHIEDFLRSGNKDRHVFKVQGEPRAFAVLEMERECMWEHLTTNFVYMGEDFYVTPLYDGRHYAADIGVNRSVIRNFTALNNEYLYFVDITFNSEEESSYHMLTMRNITETVLSSWPEESGLAFYKVLGAVPTRILFFVNLMPAEVDSLYTIFNCPALCKMKVIAIQQFRNYMFC